MKYPETRDTVQRIVELSATKSPVIVAIDGRSGTGKSTLSHWIAEQVGATLVDQDDFYSGGDIDTWLTLNPREKADRVIDWRRVRDEALRPLLAGNEARWHPFDWDKMRGLSPETITARSSNIVILDGAYSARPELAHLIDLAILVVLDDPVRRERLRQREGEDLVAEWHSIWDEAEEYYFSSVRPPHSFDVVIRRPPE